MNKQPLQDQVYGPGCTDAATPLTTAGIQLLFRRSWSAIWPLTLIMFFEFLISLTDVYIAGRVGKEVQASYGIVIQIYFVFTVLANAVTVGTVSVVSRLCKQKDSREYGQTVFSIISITVLIGVGLGALGIIFAPKIVALLNIPKTLKPFGRPLVTIYAMGLIFHYVLVNSNGILRACRGIKLSLLTMSVVCLLNVGLNFLLTFRTPLGFRGIAVSTAVSVAVGSLLNLWHLRRVLFLFRQFSVRIVRRVLSIGWPSGLQAILWHLGATTVFVMLGALPKDSVEILAAFTNGYRIEAVIYLPAYACNLANAVIVGNLLGENKCHEAFRSGLLTAAIGVGIVTIMTVLVLLNAKFVTGLLSENARVLFYSRKYLFICLAFEPVMAWGVILMGGLNGAGDTRSMARIIMLSVWLVRIPLAYLAGVYFEWGAPGVWWAMNASLISQTFFITKRYLNRRWLLNAT